LEVDNHGMTLRPDMFVDLEFVAKEPVGITIPAEAVLDSGLRKIVYIQTGENVFEPRTIEVGAAHGSSITVRRGLAPGDRVVSSGNFLLDSESRIKSNILHTIAEQPGGASDPAVADAKVRK
jgi:Cu(I)/Ag(I) efflux system membrane fusion protein